MPRITINTTTQEIQTRFFFALDTAITLGKIDGLSSFCRKNHLNRTKYSRIKNSAKNHIDCKYKCIDIDALSALCRDFGVSPTWLLLGQGKMLSSERQTL